MALLVDELGLFEFSRRYPNADEPIHTERIHKKSQPVMVGVSAPKIKNETQQYGIYNTKNKKILLDLLDDSLKVLDKFLK